MVRGAKRFKDFAEFDCRPAYPGGDEMFSELKKLRHRFYQREFDSMITPKTYDPNVAAKLSRTPPVKKISQKRGWAIFQRDLRAFAEYWAARLIVWYELRRRNKEGR